MRGWGTFVTSGLAAVLAVTAVGAAAADLHLTAADQTPVRWNQWLADRGTCAVLVWASWAPGAEADQRIWSSLERAATERGLPLVVIAVQESFADANRALAGAEVTWLHDRHGAVLKEYRVIEVPSLIVVDGEGTLRARLDPTAEALAEWRGGR
jgi:hypothetical protein